MVRRVLACKGRLPGIGCGVDDSVRPRLRATVTRVLRVTDLDWLQAHCRVVHRSAPARA